MNEVRCGEGSETMFPAAWAGWWRGMDSTKAVTFYSRPFPLLAHQLLPQVLSPPHVHFTEDPISL